MTTSDADAGPAPSEERVRRLAMVSTVAAIAPLSVLGVAVTAPSWWEGITAAIGYLLTLGVLREWSLEGYPRRAMFALAFTAVGWMIGALTATSPVSFVPVSLVGALLAARSTNRTSRMAQFALGVSAIGACALLFHPVTWQLVLLYVVTPAVGTAFIAGVILLSESIWLVVRRLEHAREVEAELAVANERVRFAGDLHDLQGHTLHVLRLKAMLARRTLRSDLERAEGELAEICRLIDQTIVQTRTLAYADHQLSLIAEVENAKRLCEAVGIEVETHVEGDAPDSHPLLPQVLREATTNLLRHAHPTTVTISATPTAVTVSNDGVELAEVAPLAGLACLRQRIEGAGGELRVDCEPSTFVVHARIGRPASKAATKEAR